MLSSVTGKAVFLPGGMGQNSAESEVGQTSPLLRALPGYPTESSEKAWQGGRHSERSGHGKPFAVVKEMEKFSQGSPRNRGNRCLLSSFHRLGTLAKDLTYLPTYNPPVMLNAGGQLD